MAMTGLALRLMREELLPLLGGKIDKIQQPDRDSVVLSFFVPADKHHARVLININHENGRVQITQSTFETPLTPPPFCTSLRKHLLGARLTEITQDGWDRVLRFALCGKNELNDEVGLQLVVELTGRHGNILLLRDGKIVDCLRHIGIGDTVTRPALPGLYYTPVAQRPQRPDPFALTAAEIENIGVAKLYTQVEGLDKKTCAALPQTAAQAQAAFADLRKGKRQFCLHPALGPMPFHCAEGQPVGSLSEAWDRCFAQKDSRLRISRQSGRLNAVLQSALKRAERKLQTCAESLQNAARADEWRKCGELLTACGISAGRGESTLAVTDYYSFPPTETAISIDPAKSVRDNAAAYFKRYRKAKTARDYAQKALPALREEAEYLRGLILQLSFCSSAADIAAIEAELTQQGYIKPESGNIKRKPPAPKPALVFFSADGTRIEAGKNNAQNDAITRAATAREWWLHAKNVPGAHVIIHAENPSAETRLFAARLAAGFSAARHGDWADVDCTQKRYVKKPSGAKPGFVTYTNQESYYVKPWREDETVDSDQ